MYNKLKIRLSALAFASIVITILMLLLFFFQKNDFVKHEETVVRQIAIAANKPPPPPPIQQSQVDTSPSINLSANGSGPVMQFTQLQLATKMDFSELPPPEITNMTSHFLDNLNVDWQAFGLDDLDGQPELLTDISIDYPRSLVRQGYTSFRIKLDVLITENGKVLLRKIIENPHPEIESLIHKLMKNVRFTSPKKGGLSVRAAFIWPLEFNHK
jgi:hypothetical protein